MSDRPPYAMQNLALHNVHSTFSFTPLANGYSLFILSLILHLHSAITIWMKTDKFSQALTIQRNGRQRMLRMIQTELLLWKQIKILPTQIKKRHYQEKN
jgi:hypothetical protein